MSAPVSRRQLREQLGPNPALDDYADARTALIIAAVNLADAVLYGRHERARELAGLVTQCSDRMSTLTLTGPKAPPTAADLYVIETAEQEITK